MDAQEGAIPRLIESADHSTAVAQARHAGGCEGRKAKPSTLQKRCVILCHSSSPPTRSLGRPPGGKMGVSSCHSTSPPTRSLVTLEMQNLPKHCSGVHHDATHMFKSHHQHAPSSPCPPNSHASRKAKSSTLWKKGVMSCHSTSPLTRSLVALEMQNIPKRRSRVRHDATHMFKS